MKKKIISITSVIVLVLLAVIALLLSGCSQADTVKNNIQKGADRFDVYRKITFVNLQTGVLLYSAEGYFSLQTTVDNTYQGQQEIGLIFKTNRDTYKMDYFSINNNVAYVIEQIENTSTNPYHWQIIWYVPLPEITQG